MPDRAAFGQSHSSPTTIDWLREVQPDLESRGLETSPDDYRLHPLVIRLLSTSPQKLALRSPRPFVDEPTFDLVVELDPGDRAEYYAGRWYSAGNGTYAVRLTQAEVRQLAEKGNYRWIGPATTYEPVSNRNRAEAGANLVHRGLWNDQPLKGEGVLVGIFDSGIDITHPSFRDPADSLRSRIKYIWDQRLTPQSGEQSPPYPFDYGVIYTRDDIEAALATGELLRSTDPTGHGTHVAGIAAGSDPQFTGIAPKADLIIVKGGDFSFSAVDIVSSTRFFEYMGETYSRPIVGNYSIGGQFSARDGTGITEQTMDEVSEWPGVLMVSAAGNSGAQLRFYEGIAGQDDIILNVPEYTPRNGPRNDRLLVDIWFDTAAEPTLTVHTPSGSMAQWAPGVFATLADSTEGVITAENLIHVPNGHRRVIFYVGDDAEEYPPAPGEWRLSLSGTDEAYKSWMVLNTVGNRTISQQGASTDYTVTSPGTGKSTITVGAYVMQNNWLDRNANVFQIGSNPIESLAFFSGLGPTRDGRMKPEITAPGRFVASARSRQSNIAVNLTSPDGEYAWLAGTSMSSPAVTGSVALLLQAFPGASSAEIKEALMESARTDHFTGSAMDNSWGAGKMNIPAALHHLSGRGGNLLWQPFNLFQNGIVKESGNDSFLLRQSGDNVLYKLPAINGVINGITLHTGEVSAGDDSDLMLEIGLAELAGDRVRVMMGDVVTLPAAELKPNAETYIDLSEFGVYLPLDYEAGIMISIAGSTGNGEDLVELLSRQTVLPASGASTWIVNPNSHRLESSNGSMLYADVSIASFNGTLDDVPPGFNIPFRISLGLNYPNPFNAQTIIPFEIEVTAAVRLEVYDVLGRRVSVLVDGERTAGRYQIPFNASGLSSGVYLYRLTVDGRTFTDKMLLLK